MERQTSRRQFLREAGTGVLGVPYVIASSALGRAGLTDLYGWHNVDELREVWKGLGERI